MASAQWAATIALAVAACAAAPAAADVPAGCTTTGNAGLNNLVLLSCTGWTPATPHERLDLGDKGFVRIMPRAFAGLRIGGDLFLGGNKELTSIEPETFYNVTVGGAISMASCDKLTTIESRAFSGATVMGSVYLDTNGITDVQPFAFAGASVGSVLDLMFNDIVTVPAYAFSNLTVGGIELTEMPTLATIEAGAFESAVVTGTLTLWSAGELTTLGPGAFRGANVTSIHIQACNKLAHIDPKAFDPAAMTLSGSLTVRQCAALGANWPVPGAFAGLSLSASLTLIDNAITGIGSGVLGGMHVGGNLVVSEPWLTEIAGGAFQAPGGAASTVHGNVDFSGAVGLQNVLSGAMRGLVVNGDLIVTSTALKTPQESGFAGAHVGGNLNLAGSGLSAIVAGTFEDTTVAATLDLHGCPNLGPSLGSEVFTGLTVSTIDLSETPKLTQLAPLGDTFHGVLFPIGGGAVRLGAALHEVPYPMVSNAGTAFGPQGSGVQVTAPGMSDPSTCEHSMVGLQPRDAPTWHGLDMVCTACFPGFYCPDGQRYLGGYAGAQIPCPPGSYSEGTGSIECTPCPAGTGSQQQAAATSTVCKPCTVPPGGATGGKAHCTVSGGGSGSGSGSHGGGSGSGSGSGSKHGGSGGGSHGGGGGSGTSGSGSGSSSGSGSTSSSDSGSGSQPKDGGGGLPTGAVVAIILVGGVLVLVAAGAAMGGERLRVCTRRLSGGAGGGRGGRRTRLAHDDDWGAAGEAYAQL